MKFVDMHCDTLLKLYGCLLWNVKRYSEMIEMAYRRYRALKKENFTENEIEKIFLKNIIRAMKDAMK